LPWRNRRRIYGGGHCGPLRTLILKNFFHSGNIILWRNLLNGRAKMNHFKGGPISRNCYKYAHQFQLHPLSIHLCQKIYLGFIRSITDFSH
jgi:hypothetical protein